MARYSSSKSDGVLSISCDISEALGFLEEAERTVMVAAEKGMAVATLDLLGEGMRNAPILTGDLRGSGSARVNGRPAGHTENNNGSNEVVNDSFKPTGLSTILHGEVGFDLEYAMNQHESMHYKHPRGGKAKFLEDPLKQKSDQYVGIIGDAVKGVL
jgi:hypothetical protein